MPVLNNRFSFTQRRKNLRNTATPQERMLWLELKNSKLGFKFRRQHGIGPYVLDFYCPLMKLAIEIDGSQHFEEKVQNYDEKRTAYLESVGITVLRFTNAQINRNIQGVVLKIQEILQSPPRLSGTPPR